MLKGIAIWSPATISQHEAAIEEGSREDEKRNPHRHGDAGDSTWRPITFVVLRSSCLVHWGNHDVSQWLFTASTRHRDPVSGHCGEPPDPGMVLSAVISLQRPTTAQHVVLYLAHRAHYLTSWHETPNGSMAQLIAIQRCHCLAWAHGTALLKPNTSGPDPRWKQRMKIQKTLTRRYLGNIQTADKACHRMVLVQAKTSYESRVLSVERSVYSPVPCG